MSCNLNHKQKSGGQNWIKTTPTIIKYGVSELFPILTMTERSFRYWWHSFWHCGWRNSRDVVSATGGGKIERAGMAVAECQRKYHGTRNPGGGELYDDPFITFNTKGLTGLFKVGRIQLIAPSDSKPQRTNRAYTRCNALLKHVANPSELGSKPVADIPLNIFQFVMIPN